MLEHTYAYIHLVILLLSFCYGLPDLHELAWINRSHKEANLIKWTLFPVTQLTLTDPNSFLQS